MKNKSYQTLDGTQWTEISCERANEIIQDYAVTWMDQKVESSLETLVHAAFDRELVGIRLVIGANLPLAHRCQPRTFFSQSGPICKVTKGRLCVYDYEFQIHHRPGSLCWEFASEE